MTTIRTIESAITPYRESQDGLDKGSKAAAISGTVLLVTSIALVIIISLIAYGQGQDRFYEIFIEEGLVYVLSTLAGIGLVGLVSSLAIKMCASKEEVPEQMRTWGPHLEKARQVYNPEFEKAASVIANLPTPQGRRDAIVALNNKDYRDFFISFYVNCFNLDSGQCVNPMIINDLKIHPNYLATFQELQPNFDPRFIPLFD